MAIFNLFFLLLLLTNILHAADSITILEAYSAIPHARTVFNIKEATSSGMLAEDSQFLHQIFVSVEEGIVLKVSIQKKKVINANSSYKQLIQKIENLNGHEKFSNFKALIIGALRDHATYFESQHSDKPAANALIQASSGKLREAYSILMKLFPDQSAQNRQAFFDYLCALDFI